MAIHSSILARESHGQGSLASYSPYGCRESDMTKPLTLSRNQVVEVPCLTPALRIEHGAFKYQTQMLPASIFFKMGL